MQGAEGLPLGVQLVGPRHGDARLLRTARWLVNAVGKGCSPLLPRFTSSSWSACARTPASTRQLNRAFERWTRSRAPFGEPLFWLPTPMRCGRSGCRSGRASFDQPRESRIGDEKASSRTQPTYPEIEEEVRNDQGQPPHSTRPRGLDSPPRVRPLRGRHRVLQEGLRRRGAQSGARPRRAPDHARGHADRRQRRVPRRRLSGVLWRQSLIAEGAETAHRSPSTATSRTAMPRSSGPRTPVPPCRCRRAICSGATAMAS